MSELSILIAYLRVTFMLFFITFFIRIFMQYFKEGLITPQKILTYKKGGLFEHYKAVGIIMFSLLMIHGIFNVNPMATGEESNWLSWTLEFILMYIPLVIFTVFFFIFIFFTVLYIIARLKKIKHPGVFIQTKARLIIHIAFLLGFLIVSAIMAYLLINTIT